MEFTAQLDVDVVALEGEDEVTCLVSLTAPVPEEYGRGLTRSAPLCLATRVLIVAEASIPQCLKYRVVQRQEAFRRLGVECTWRSWGDRAPVSRPW